MRTLHGEIGDLKRRSCQLVVQNTGQMKSSKTPVNPEKALGLTCVRSLRSREVRDATGDK